MDQRSTLMNANLSGGMTVEPFLEVDLRDLFTSTLLGRRGQLQFTTKLVFKAEDSHRKAESMIELWADVRVSGQDQVPMPGLGRARVPDPIIFAPPGEEDFWAVPHDPWMRAVDRLTLDLDHRQLDEIEKKRQGGPLFFWFAMAGLVYHEGKVASLYPVNNQVTYEVSQSDWIKLLNQLEYGTYVTIEVPLERPSGLTGEIQKAAQALREAVAAFRRGDYEEAVADCRPGLDALGIADDGKFTLKPWDQTASKDERFYWMRRALLSVTHLAHHPSGPRADTSASVPSGPIRWERADAEAAIAMLGTLIRQRTGSP